MKSINLTRLTIGIMIIVGLLFFKPLAYFTGIMMIFAGLTEYACWRGFMSGFSELVPDVRLCPPAMPENPRR